jgi:hypothetical protein
MRPSEDNRSLTCPECGGWFEIQEDGSGICDTCGKDRIELPCLPPMPEEIGIFHTKATTRTFVTVTWVVIEEDGEILKTDSRTTFVCRSDTR